MNCCRISLLLITLIPLFRLWGRIIFRYPFFSAPTGYSSVGSGGYNLA